MGGPFIGDVSIGDDLMSKDCLLDNFVYKEEMNLLFFVKYHKINYYQYFTINFYNLDTETVYEFDKEFEKLYIGEFISKNELEIYPAFHDGLKNLQQIFNLDEEDFQEIS